MANPRKRKTNFVRLPELEQAFRSNVSVSSIVTKKVGQPKSPSSTGRRWKGVANSTDSIKREDFPSTIGFAINKSATSKTGRHRRDSDLKLLEHDKTQVDIDAAFIAKYDSLINPPSHSMNLDSKDLNNDGTHTTYAAAAQTEPTSSQDNFALHGVVPAALTCATDAKPQNGESKCTNIGRDMRAPKKTKRVRSRNNTNKSAGISQSFKNQKERTVLRLEDDVDRGFSVTGHRRFNAKRFNEHWEQQLPIYYKYRKD